MEDIVEKTFEALFALEDVRQIWRDAAPLHNFSEDQKMELFRLLNLVKRNADAILERIGNR